MKSETPLIITLIVFLNSFLLEDIDVEIGSMWIHLTLFDQKLLKNWN